MGTIANPKSATVKPPVLTSGRATTLPTRAELNSIKTSNVKPFVKPAPPGSGKPGDYKQTPAQAARDLKRADLMAKMTALNSTGQTDKAAVLAAQYNNINPTLGNKPSGLNYETFAVIS